LKDLTELNLL